MPKLRRDERVVGVTDRSLRDGEGAFDVHGGQLCDKVLEHEGERHPRNGVARLAHPAHNLPLAVYTCTHMTTGHIQKPRGNAAESAGTNQVPQPHHWKHLKQE